MICWGVWYDAVRRDCLTGVVKIVGAGVCKGRRYVVNAWYDVLRRDCAVESVSAGLFSRG